MTRKQRGAPSRLRLRREPAPPLFPPMEAPNVAAINEVHGEHPGLVLFTKGKGVVHSSPAAELEHMFPAFADDLVRDTYYSLAGYNPRGDKGRRGKHVRAITENVSHLPAVWLDLDCWQVGKLQGEVVGLVWEASRRGIIPSPSIIADSGRGIWLLWLVRDENGIAPRATTPNVLLHHRITAEIINSEMFRALGADPSCNQIARITRTPGSLNSKAGKNVRYWSAKGDDGHPITYSLPELARLFEIDPETVETAVQAYHPAPPYPDDSDLSTEPPARWIPRKEVDQVKSAAAKKGHGNRRQNTLQALVLLCEKRGGFREAKPTRNLAAYWLAVALRWNGKTEGEIHRYLSAPGRFHPALSSAEIRGHVRKSLDFRHVVVRAGARTGVGYDRIATDLGITEDEAAEIRVRLGIRRFPFAGEKHARQALIRRGEIIVPPSREDAAKSRRAALLAIVQGTRENGLPFPSLAYLQRELFETYGVRVRSRETIRTDLRTMGFLTSLPPRLPAGPEEQPLALPFE